MTVRRPLEGLISHNPSLTTWKKKPSLFPHTPLQKLRKIDCSPAWLSCIPNFVPLQKAEEWRRVLIGQIQVIEPHLEREDRPKRVVSDRFLTRKEFFLYKKRARRDLRQTARDIQFHTLSLDGRSRGKLIFYVFMYMSDFHLRLCTIFHKQGKSNEYSLYF